MHQLTGVFIIFLIFTIKLSTGIKCYHCDESPVEKSTPVCYNKTSETSNIGVLKECGHEKDVCFMLMHRPYTPQFGSEVEQSTGAVEKGCILASDGSDHLMKCFLEGRTKLRCFCKDEDGCNNGSSRSVLSICICIIISVFHLIRT